MAIRNMALMSDKYRSMSPDEMRRSRSGIWERRFAPDTCYEEWACDLFKLEDKIRELHCSDPTFRQSFAENPRRTLDLCFGQGTAEAYFMKRRHPGDRIHFRVPPDYGYKMYDQYDKRPMRPTSPKDRKDTVTFERRLVRNLPFVHGGDGLAATLQREFDHWAGDQVRNVQSWVA